MYKADFYYNWLCVLPVGDGINIGLEISFANLQDWKEIRAKAGEVNCTKADKTNAENLCRILNDCYASKRPKF
jgi:hypothetical protein